MGNVHTVGPNEALVISGVAQVKVMRDPNVLSMACEQFLGKSIKDIQNTILQTLEGHLRAILGTLSVEEIYGDREKFALLVREVASPDVAKMGIEILSFTIKDVFDNVEYLNSLGRAQTANVKRDAEIGVAEAERDAGIREAECNKIQMDACYIADTQIANATRDFDIQKSNFDQEVNKARAEAELAYQLQAAKEQQKIRAEEVNIQIVGQRKEIEIADKQVFCTEMKMNSTVRRPAEADAYKVQQIAEAERKKKILVAQAQAEAIRIQGKATASVVEAKGQATAKGMRLRAGAFEKYGDAGILSMILDGMPRIAAEVSAPLAQTKEIVLMGGSGGSNQTPGHLTALGQDFATMLGTMPQAVRALTQVDLTKSIGKIPGAQVVN